MNPVGTAVDDVEDVRAEEANALETAEPVVPEPSDWRRFVPVGLAALVPIALFFLLPPLSKSGLWDPYELNVADLARRLALNLYGAGHLALDGADNSLPHLNDLGRPELPFESIAVGFKLFGLHEWAGRTPLAIWGLAGVLATYAWVARLVDKRAGLFSAVVLATMPLYFVQARTMLGDIVPMASFAMAFGGLLVSVFDRDEDGPAPLAKRAPWLAMAVVGLAGGFMSRGGLIGLGVPAVGVLLAWGVSHAVGARQSDRTGDAIAAIFGGIGVFAVGKALFVLAGDKPVNLNMWVGAMVKPPGKYPTYDFTIGHIAHGAAPWSAFVPFAFGRLFIAPVGVKGSAARRETDTRLALLVGASFALFAHGWLAAKTDLVAFSALAALAAGCGIALRDFERGAHASPALGVGVAVLLGLLHHDFHELPEKAYQAFAIAGPTFPDSFKDHALLLWTAALVGFALLSLVTWVERSSKRTPFDPATYLGILRALREAWDGLLALGFFATVAGASLAGLAIWIGVRFHIKWMPTLSLQVRDGVLNAWWILAFVPLGIIFATQFACDAMLWAFGHAKALSTSSITRGFEPFEELYARLRGETKPTEGNTLASERLVATFVILPFMVLAVPAGVMAGLVAHGTKPLVSASLAVPSGVAVFLVLGLIGDLLRGRRAAFIPLVGVASGLVMCLWYYPALANQLSPKEVFESYQKVHKGGEPLALFGVGGRTAAYYAGGQPTQLKDVNGAFDWLVAPSEGRRYEAIKAEELPKLNQLYRQRQDPETRENLPVLDSRSSQIVLIASKLEPGEKNQSPLGKILLPPGEKPKIQHPLDVNMEDKLEVLGYDVTDEQGRWVNAVAPGRAYRMRTYYKVLAPVTTEWEAFIHIDGFRRRHNGDHKPMEGKYPFSLWLPGDTLVDDYEFKLEPNFTQGAYTVFFGLFVGDTRLKVKSGASDGDNRINGGTMHVQ